MIGGIDYESLDYAGRDYAVKRLEAALRSLDDRTRLYQIFAKHNRPEISHAEYDDPLIRATVDQRAAFLRMKSESLYSVEGLSWGLAPQKVVVIAQSLLAWIFTSVPWMLDRLAPSACVPGCRGLLR
jgi:hypothetical protein